MPVSPDAAIEISALAWVPEAGRGLVRDLRVRWALEEAGLDYRVRLLPWMTPRTDEYLAEQPFGQVPIFIEGDVHMFETGAILLHIGARSETLVPADEAKRARAMTWVVAALNTIEPPINELVLLHVLHAGEPWVEQRRPQLIERIRDRLGKLAARLGDKDHLEGDFTAGDLMMASVLRILRRTGLVAEFPNLAAYVARCEARPAFERALVAQLADFQEETTQ